jgi:flavin reductase (DIM6/NTAB) family NADH-FMN oxidoreductase RutF
MERLATFEAERFREVLGHLPTGVVVIAAETLAGPVGMAVNSFTSVSLDPALVLFCPARTSTTWPQLRRVRRFCANFLADEHEDVSRRFAGRDPDRFAGVGWQRTACGPCLDGVSAWLGCEIQDEHEAGDHTIVVARVLCLDFAPATPPLVFHRGRYAAISSG